jgi:hypothetical protein
VSTSFPSGFESALLLLAQAERAEQSVDTRARGE